MRSESSSLRSVSADSLFRLELTKYLVPIVSAQPQHTLLRAHLVLLSGGVVLALPELPAQYAKYILQLTTFCTPRKASAGAGSPLDTIVSSADFVLHTARARLNNTLARNFSASDGVRPPCGRRSSPVKPHYRALVRTPLRRCPVPHV